VEYLDAVEAPVKFVNIVQTSGSVGASVTEGEQIVGANMTTIENSNGERQIIQVIREPIEGSVAIATEKGDDTIYEFDQSQYITIPNNALSNIQVFLFPFFSR
jgi:hypothetical protein